MPTPAQLLAALFVCTSPLATARPRAIQQQHPTAQPVAAVPTSRAPTPPLTVEVPEPSQVPVIVVGILTLIVLVVQARTMSRQTTLFDRQTALLEQQAAWRRDEAIGTFYRLAHDLVSEFRKANVLPTVQMQVDYGSHPRQMLREASRLFAPLGNDFVFATNAAGHRLDEYFSAVEAYNRGRFKDGDLWESVQTFRELVGQDLDHANSQLDAGLRWTTSDGKDYDFRTRCSLPPGLLEAGDTELTDLARLRTSGVNLQARDVPIEALPQWKEEHMEWTGKVAAVLGRRMPEDRWSRFTSLGELEVVELTGMTHDGDHLRHRLMLRKQLAVLETLMDELRVHAAAADVAVGR